MASRQTDEFGNPVHLTGTTGQGVPLGAPGTTGAVETHDPLGAPGSTGAYRTTAAPGIGGHDAGHGGQEQLHRTDADSTGGGGGHRVTLRKEHDTVRTHGVTPTGTQGYAYGTAASMGPPGHAGVTVPLTTGITGTYGTDYDAGGHKSTDIGHTGVTTGGKTHGVGGHASGYDTGGDKARGQGVGEHGSGYDTGGLRSTDTSRTGEIGHGVAGLGSRHDEDKGVMEKIREHLPGTRGGTK